MTRNANETASASFSVCRTWRYTLKRTFAPSLYATKPHLIALMLNPSTADEQTDDPTIRRVRGFATAWGHRGFIVLNLFAYRATDPFDLQRAHDAGVDVVGPENDVAIYGTISGTIPCDVLVGWGAFELGKARGEYVARAFPNVPMLCLGTTQHGQPRHPLYVPSDTKPELWKP